MARVDEILDELRQEVIEARNQTIKTDNSLRNLVGDVRAIARRQEAYEARISVNSVGAYLIFAVLAFAGLLLFFRASIERAELDRELATREQETLLARIDELETDASRRREAEEEAYAFYELLASGRRDEAVERFATVQGRLVDRATIELFRREVDRIRHELALETYQLGVLKAESDDWAEARDAFLRSVSYIELAAYSPNLQFLLGEAYFELDDYGGAVRYYDLALASDGLDRTQSITAMYRRADSLRRLERLSDAAEAYRLFARRYDSHPWAATARERSASIERRLDAE